MQIADLVLLPAAGEPSLDADELALDIARFERELDTSGSRLSAECCSVDAPTVMEWAGHFVVMLAPAALPALSAAIGAWLHARLGRKVSLRIGDLEAQASTVEEVERLLDKARAFRADDSQP